MNKGEKGEEIWLQSFVCARVETFTVFFLPFFPPIRVNLIKQGVRRSTPSNAVMNQGESGGKRGKTMVTKICIRAGRNFYRLLPSLFSPSMEQF
ncbi:MAG: hypothetical protein DBP02_16655 [gamma proteobacterium symbiont of Ctena orbiculata]|nr:MAG: hypothetical protein DBP02_16655 [gamma proteobacterium symbiont of Ctena orbiculata]